MLGRFAAGILLLVLVFAAVPAVLAQGGDEIPSPDIVLCSSSECRYSNASGDLTYEEIELVMGEPDPHGNNLVVCQGNGCMWSALTGEDIELIMDSEILNSEDTMIELEDQDLSFTSLVPLAGSWTTYHDPTVMECSTGMAIDVPGSGPETVTISVAEDGSTLTGLNLDPEMPPQTMTRMPDGHYHDEMTFEQDGGTMDLVFEVFFLDETLGFGFIDAQIESQGFTCTILRSFVTELEGASPEPEEAATE